MPNNLKCFNPRCIVNKIGEELPPPLVDSSNNKCSTCTNLVAENTHSKCYECFHINDEIEYRYYHSECLKHRYNGN